MYYIVQRVTPFGFGLKYTPVGYVLTEEDIPKVIDEALLARANKILDDNREGLIDGTVLVGDLFVQNSVESFLVCNTQTTNIDGQDLPELTGV